jgi:hypothetical protein
MTRRGRQQDVDSAIRCLHATEPVLRPDCTVTAAVRVGPIPLCSSCHHHRSSVGKGQPSRALPTGPKIDLLAWISTAHPALEQAEQTLHATITRARHNGTTWTEIGTQLGITKQAAQQRFTRASLDESTKRATRAS